MFSMSMMASLLALGMMVCRGVGENWGNLKFIPAANLWPAIVENLFENCKSASTFIGVKYDKKCDIYIINGAYLSTSKNISY